MKKGVIQPIEFDQIFKYWSQYLWAGRNSKIEPTSAIDSDGKIDCNILKFHPSFFAYIEDNTIIGVVGGQRTSDWQYRSRGIWVSSEFRGRGVGRALISSVEKQAKIEKCSTLWSMPRESSIVFYKQVGFKIKKMITEYEFGPHYLVEKEI